MKSGAVLALVGLLVFAAGCGSSSNRSAGQLGTTTTSVLEQADHYSACMRSHGVPNFPDPTSGPGGTVKMVVVSGKGGTDPHGAPFVRAAAACASLAPPSQNPAPSQQQLADALSFAHCIRARGIANFPDPNSHGLTLEMLKAAGIDVRAPNVIAAAQACVPASHGAVTAQKIQQVVAEATQRQGP